MNGKTYRERRKERLRNAIVVGAKDTGIGILSEHAYLSQLYPSGYQLISQGLDSEGDKYYDTLCFKTRDGEMHQVIFDITAFYGKPWCAGI